jgi:5-formyltetrahydrofolate cyclo-ligase
MSEQKTILRTRLLAARRALPDAVAGAASRAIAGRLIALPQFGAAPSVLLYSPAAGEVDTGVIREAAEAAGKAIYYPRTTGGSSDLEFVRMAPGGGLRRGRWGVGEPEGGTIFEPGSPALVVVPGVGFDRRGLRLGRGGGWYDRALGRLRPPATVVGLAFAVQVLPSLPRAAWDAPVDILLTERETILLNLAPDGGGT